MDHVADAAVVKFHKGYTYLILGGSGFRGGKMKKDAVCSYFSSSNAN
jgi:hypothetical protein